ncbi:MAG: EI24 domain-containing protein [Pseudomonadota bacterium]
MISFFSGLGYQLRGLRMAFRTPRLLMLGLARLLVVLALAAAASAAVLAYHSDILNALWTRPESAWLVWLWVLASWLLALLLVGVAAVCAYLVAQVLFAVVIMDLMSRITERMATGEVRSSPEASLGRQLAYLIGQEMPRAILPVLISLLVFVVGWLTPAGPIVAILSSLTAAVFLAWDNTDLVPARRMVPFKERFGLFVKTLPFHIGFGVWFLIPVANIVFLCFAPVGATLYQVEKRAEGATDAGNLQKP